MSRLLLKIVIALVVALVIALVRVLIRAVRSRSGARSYTSTLPPPPKGTRQPVLIGVAGTYKGSMVPMDSGPVIIGRDPGSANLVFPDDQRTISSKHCIVKVTNGRFYLEDCYSTNGTYLANGRSVAPGQATELKAGDRFSIGDRKNAFEVSFR